MAGFFKDINKATYKGPESNDPLAFRHYDKNKVVGDKTLEEHLRFAVCYWHTFCYGGADPFGGNTFERAWFGDTMEHAKIKADEAFDLFEKLDAPYFCFHDLDVRPEGDTLAESNKNLHEIADIFAQKMEKTGTKLLWGTANLFSHPRYMAGAATNPDADVFAYAAATVKECMDVTKKLNGENYVLWGGREGYETLLNTNIGHELDQMGRFLSLVVDYKHKIGFKGTILLEPKPQEPSKHQYDYDAATVYGFLKKYGLENEVKLNLETGHAFLAGHSFEHEIAVADSLGIFGSIDMNRNDIQSGWDTDQFPNNVSDVALAYYYILKAGGLNTGGTNFDSRIRRQSFDAVDIVHGHIGAMDICAKGFMAAHAMMEDGSLDKHLNERYQSWDNPNNKSMLDGTLSLEEISQYAHTNALNPQPKSGRQEYLENVINRFL